ncbi:MAG: OmpA family protein, partial [Candidatus Kapaibacterium sp.]
DVLCSISPDGKTALLARTQSDNGNPLARLFVMEQTDSGWSAPKQVSVEGFSGRTSHIYAHLSFDNAILFLAVDVPERGMDLFACRRVDTVPQAWRFSRPVPLGDVINTRGTEGSPFLAYDGTTFYFTSDRYGGYGSQDVFMTRRLDSTLTSWSRPVNLGDRINTGFLDHCFSLSADGSTALIVSSDSLFGAGVFEVTLPSSLRMGPSIVGAIVGTDAGTSRRTADTIVLTVTFPTNSTRMRETNVDSVLSSTIHRWRDRPLRILISGHTDRTGIEARNSTLSMRRAVTLRRAVLAALKKRRRSKTSVTFACVGRGISEPVGDDRTEAGRQANRRATARIIIGIGPVASKPDGDLKRSGRAGRRRR